MLALLVLPALALAQPASFTIDTDALIATIPPRFISFGWEMDCMINLLPSMADPRFAKVASHLAPATVRVGGITGDWVRYTEIPGHPDSGVGSRPAQEGRLASRGVGSRPAQEGSLSSRGVGYWPTQEGNLSMPMFQTLTAFLSAANFSLLFMLNELHGRDCNTTKPGTSSPDWCTGAWDSSNARAFLQYLHDTAQVGGSAPTYAFELGNELVSHLPAETVTADIIECAGIIQDIWRDVPLSSRPGLVAPSTDDCYDPQQLEIMANITGTPGVAAYSFHGYPGGGGPGFNMTQLLLNATWLDAGIMTGSGAFKCLEAWNAGPRAAGLQLLLTESSSSWDVQLPPPAQNSVLHTLFTVAELGQYAATGVGMVARWALSEGSPFATMALNHSSGSWDVAADYWLLLAHKRSVGGGVLRAVPALPPAATGVLAYAHCAAGGGRNGSVALTAVNTGEAPVALALNVPAAPRWEYIFTAPGGDLAATAPLLNGAALLRMQEDGSLPDDFVAKYVAEGAVVLPARSSAVLVLLAGGAAACSSA